ncbi:flavofamily protein, partial [Vibrio parahaemolyticus VPTS-2010]
KRWWNISTVIQITSLFVVKMTGSHR